MGLSCSCMDCVKAPISASPANQKNLKIIYAGSNEKADFLFDFEAKQDLESQEIKNEAIIRETEGHFEIKPDVQENEKTLPYLLKITLEDQEKISLSGLENFCFDNFKENCLWRVIRKHQINEIDKVQLQVNDVIRFGRLPFHIKDIHIKPKSMFFEKSIFNKEKKPTASNNLCRICLSNEETEDNPLISPCKCKGSLQYIHFCCLQKWISEKTETTEDDLVLIYVWKEFICEICKTSFQINHKVKGKNRHILEMKPIKNSYVLFESILPDEQKKLYLFYVNLDEQKEIILGRYLDCDIRINDISVSRFHARITLSNGKVFIEDLESKFGTLLLAHRPTSSTEKQYLNTTFQYRSTLFKITQY